MNTPAAPDYTQWSADQLLDRVQKLEKELRDANAKYQALAILNSPRPSTPASKEKGLKSDKPFDFCKYSTRLIALKFAYLGQNYNGFEYHANNTTPLPTIEETLWAALMKAKLIFPTNKEAVDKGQATWEGCDYSKCGRTDRGVSAFGQVVSIRVRSNQLAKMEAVVNGFQTSEEQSEVVKMNDQVDDEDATAPEPDFDPVADEILYTQVLNRLLPADIRILAWCPNPPIDFNARFSCRERRYRYFFTQPAFNPTFGQEGLRLGLTKDAAGQVRREGWLDIMAMQEAAKRFEGLHDFRNFCKIDPSKQISDFRRRIFHAEIRAVSPADEPAAYIAKSTFNETETGPLNSVSNSSESLVETSPFSKAPQIYQFILHGSAFLWHQVRHMIAILFLVGQGLEQPSLVTSLLDSATNPSKPHYEMADDAPLVLWDCIFPDLTTSADVSENGYTDALKWNWVGDHHGSGDERLHVTSGFRSPGKYGLGGLVDGLWREWRRRKMDEVLAGTLLNVAAAQGRNDDVVPRERDSKGQVKQKVYVGGDSAPPKGHYIPVLNRPRMEAPEVVNQKYVAKKGPLKRSEGVEELRQRSRTGGGSDHTDVE